MDQPTVREKTQITRVHGQGARLEAMSLQPAFAFFALFAVALLRCDTPRAMTLAGKGSGETARHGECIGK
jgi:hypothetical protein